MRGSAATRVGNGQPHHETGGMHVGNGTAASTIGNSTSPVG